MHDLLKQSVLNPQSEDSLLTDAIDLFTNRKKGNLAHRSYSTPKALEYWSSFMRHEKYYVTSSEISLIPEVVASINDIAPHINGIIGVENGVGTTNAMHSKTIPFFSRIKELHTYVGRDWSEKITINVGNILPKYLKNIQIISDCSNFKTQNLPDGLPLGRKIITEMGVTVGNLIGDPQTQFLEKALLSDFKFQRSLLNTGDLYIPSIDMCEDWDTIISAYTSPWLQKFVTELFKYLQTTLPFTEGFNPNGFVFQAIAYPKTYMCSHTMIALQDMDFYIEKTPIQIKKGDEFIVANSGKPPKSMVDGIAKTSGFRVVKYVQDTMGLIAFPIMMAE